MVSPIYSFPNSWKVYNSIAFFQLSFSIFSFLKKLYLVKIKVKIHISWNPLSIFRSYTTIPASIYFPFKPLHIWTIRIWVRPIISKLSVLLIKISSFSKILHILKNMRMSNIYNNPTLIISRKVFSSRSIF